MKTPKTPPTRHTNNKSTEVGFEGRGGAKLGNRIRFVRASVRACEAVCAREMM